MMPEPVQENPILKRIWKRVHRKNKNFMAALCAETGFGKSWAALRMAEALDTDFSVDQVAFSGKEFMDIVNDDSYGEGTVIVFDEAGVGQGSREWYTDSNIMFNYVMQTWRHENKIALFTLPALHLLDSTSRGLLHAYMEGKKLNAHQGWSEWKYMRIQQNPKSGKIYYKHPKLRMNGKRKKINSFKVGKPTDNIVDQYEAKKKSYTEEINEAAAKTFGGGDGEDGDMSAQEVAQDIVNEDRVDEFIADNYGQKYLDRDMIEVEYGIGDSKSKKVKKILKRDLNLAIV